MQGFYAALRHLATLVATWGSTPVLKSRLYLGIFDFAVVAFLAGCVLYFAVPSEPAEQTLWVICGFLVGCVGLLKHLIRSGKTHAVQSLVILAAFSAGFGYSQAYMLVLSTPFIKSSDQWTDITGVITRLEARQDQDILDIRVIHAPETPEIKDHKVRIWFRGKTRAGISTLTAGDTLSVSAILSPPKPPIFPGSQDQRLLFFTAGLAASGYAVAAPNVLSTPYTSNLEDLRIASSRLLAADMDAAPGAVARAILIGDRSGITPALRESFRDSGLAHLLAISGLHLGLVTGMVFVMVRGLLLLVPTFALKAPIKSWAAVIALISGGIFCLFTGASVPTIRAFIMTSLFFLGIVLYRRAISRRLVSIAALLVILTNPTVILGASFQLSFAAVISLIAIYEGVRDRRGYEARQTSFLYRPFQYLGGILLTSLIAGLATAPFAMAHFNVTATYGFVANLLAVPLMGFVIMPLGLLTLLLMPFSAYGWDLHGPSVILLDQSLSWLITIAETTANWPNSHVLTAHTPNWMIGVLALSLLLLCWGGKWRDRMGGAALFASVVVAMTVAAPPDITIGPNGDRLGVRAQDGRYYYVGGSDRSFAARVWAAKAGESSGDLLNRPQSGVTLYPGASCDPEACVLPLEHQTVVAVRTAYGLWQECQTPKAETWVIALGQRKPPQPETCAQDVLYALDFSKAHGASAWWLTPDMPTARKRFLTDQQKDTWRIWYGGHSQ